MTNSVKIDDKNIATFDIKIDSKVVKDAYERTLKAYASNVNIAGFRRGKAPAPIVEKYVGQERIKAEVIDRLFPSEFQKVVDEKESLTYLVSKLNLYQVKFDDEIKENFKKAIADKNSFLKEANVEKKFGKNIAFRKDFWSFGKKEGGVPRECYNTISERDYDT